jgi:Major Facilitator Superfamily
MGTLGDRIGRRRLLLTGAATFGAASVLAAYATSAGMLIAARPLLGVAGATLAPSTLSLLRTMFADPRQRTLAIAVWISSFQAGGTAGQRPPGVHPGAAGDRGQQRRPRDRHRHPGRGPAARGSSQRRQCHRGTTQDLGYRPLDRSPQGLTSPVALYVTERTPSA